ncbi:MAG: DUF2851 family protein [Planctomycetota bacterium]|jgi:hypothetical protein|nr:DUF2851 family protein [Planctomycetota bacterium]
MHRFTERYRTVLEQASGVTEPRLNYRGMQIRERVVRCIWYGQYLATESLTTVDGESVRVVTPGWWNVEAGPDFLKAELVFGDGEVQRCDVEIHLEPSGWYQHSHHEDPAYNNVLLHVVLWNDSDDDFIVNQSGQPIRQLVIEDNIDGDLKELLSALDQGDFPRPEGATAGLCHQYLEEGTVSEEWVGDFLDHAGDERILRKAQYFGHRSQIVGEDQIFYELLMQALGYKRNKQPFEELAREATLKKLRHLLPSGVKAVQAALFHAAGLMPLEQFLPGMPDPETYDLTREYREQLRNASEIKSNALSTAWSFSGTRPVNFPQRRIAGVAHFIHQYHDDGILNSVHRALPQKIVRKEGFLVRKDILKVMKSVDAIFAGIDDPYWALRCKFGGKETKNPMRLIGKERVEIILINVLLPALLGLARKDGDEHLESFLHQLYDQMPPQPESSVTRFMVDRVLGGPERSDRLITNSRRQQGLYQIFNDFERDDRSCEDCAFARAMLMT